MATKKRKRSPAPDCPKCHLPMRRVYVHRGFEAKQRMIGIGWVCLNCKTFKWDYPVCAGKP